MNTVFGETLCQNVREALKREWLETNGIGGYASSTILCCHTRRYHGLLAASLAEPPGRFVLLSKFEDSVSALGREFFLSCHRYPGLFFPHGHQYLREFRSERHPLFVYRVGDTVIHRSVMLVHGENTVLVRYFAERSDIPFALLLKPFLAFRGHHELAKENTFLQARAHPAPNGFWVQPYQGMPTLTLRASVRPKFYPTPLWYRNFEYPEEQARGQDFREDLFSPGIIEVPMHAGEAIVIAASAGEPPEDPAAAWDAEERRRNAEDRVDSAVARRIAPAQADRYTVRQLSANARHFLVRLPPDRPAVIAGYPWFDAWGRDTLIALPGLAFCTGRLTEGAAILDEFGRHERNGLLPNILGAGAAGSAYNTVDASLWYFWTVQQFLRAGGRPALVRDSYWPVMQNILRHYMAGTEFGIGMTTEGLLQAGSPGTQLTWMDAMVGGRPVTPRHGCAVEINALWYNALCFAAELAKQFGEPGVIPPDLSERAAAAFGRAFWIEEGQYLGDVRRPDGSLDASVRPNQILAASLPHSPLRPEQRAAVVKRVQDELLTPFGLRTLSPRSEWYQGRYGGSSEARDGAYHQGTVWPWLLGHFGEASLRAARSRFAAVRFLRQTLRPLLGEHLETAGIGCISEVFDGDPPHAPNGCIAQAWSVAEIIRLLALMREDAGGKDDAL